MLINGRVTWQDNRDNNRTKQKFVNAKKHYGKNSIANWIHNELSGDENGTQEITKKTHFNANTLFTIKQEMTCLERGEGRENILNDIR